MNDTLTFDQYQKGLEQGQLLGLHCESCKAITFPPQGVCHKCSGSRLKSTEMCGKGTIRTFTVVRVAPEGKLPPYVVAMVELEEGPWVMGNLLNIDPNEANMSLMGEKVNVGSQVVEGDVYSIGDTRVITFTVDTS
jgi:uncharacterized OB-fold protein